ncbi:hypothetical protein [Actinomadura sp. NEAU-AAG7]|uniref:hypothetical protein n=1 Tax=Actinomadura sp. NEAU-AAG7 TaxID=2839640 RepID=UPI001BE43F91|nr:hypothetical protein [Actinomadura sp. NEAU-AAG7]MBT2213287.1 hypothetical protein [Actinomadura sp. NEAU-AAG7]
MFRRIRIRRVHGAAAVIAVDLLTRVGLIAAAVAMAAGAGGAAFPLGHAYWIVAALSAVPRAGVVVHVDREAGQRVRGDR